MQSSEEDQIEDGQNALRKSISFRDVRESRLIDQSFTASINAASHRQTLIPRRQRNQKRTMRVRKRSRFRRRPWWRSGEDPSEDVFEGYPKNGLKMEVGDRTVLDGPAAWLEEAQDEAIVLGLGSVRDGG